MAQPLPASTPSSAPAGGPSLRMVVTGRSGGLAGASATGDTILLLYEELTARGGATRVTGSRFTLHDNFERILATKQENDVDTAISLLKDSAQEDRRVIAEQIPALESDRAIVIQYPPKADLDLLKLMEQRNARSGFAPRLKRLSLRLVELRVGERRVRFFERSGSAKKSLRRDPLAWELGWLISGEGRLANRRAPFTMLIKPFGQGARRARLVSELAAKVEGTLLLSAGNEVSTRSPSTGKPSRTRDLDFDTLSKLAYDAYLPGYRELYFGLEKLQERVARHPLPLLATNLVYRGSEKKGKPVFVRYRLKRVGKLRIAIIGLVDPDFRDKVHSPKLVRELEVLDPLVATTHVISELALLPDGRPDLVIALSNLGDRQRAKLLAQSHGLDLVLGDFHAGRRPPPAMELDLGRRHERMRNARGVAYVSRLSYALVGEIAIDFEETTRGLHPSRLRARSTFVDSTLPRDEKTHRKLMKDLLSELRRYRGEVLPPVEDIIGADTKLRQRLREDPEIAEWLPKSKTGKWQLWMTSSLWSNLLANLLMGATQAEVAIAPRPERLSSTVPGPILERYVRQWLDKDEPVRLYELTGAQLRVLLRALKTTRARYALTGIEPNSELIGGRRLAAKEQYRVALTRSLSEDDELSLALKGIEPQERFDVREEGALLLPESDGKHVKLRELAVARLKWLRKQHGGVTKGYLRSLRGALSPQGRELTPRWSLAARNVSLSFAGYGNSPSSAWTRNPGTRETRTVTPGNYALGARGELALLYDSPSLAWETAARFKFSRVVIDLSPIPGQDEVVNEPAGQDDIVAFTELRLKFIELAIDRKRHISIVPYTQLAFDTEFTATKDQITGATYPHQKQLRVAAGLSSKPGRILTEVRFGGLFKNDFDLDEGQAEGGLTAGAQLSFPIFGATFDLFGALQYYFATSDDTVEDLGLIFEGLARLRVPFTRTLSLSLFADLFLYKHKVARVTDIFGNNKLRSTGVSLILGAGLSFDHILKL